MDVTEAIHETVEEWGDKPEVINSGGCGRFAEEVAEKVDGVELMETRDVVNGKKPYHVWLTDGELHYDAEHPEGVESPFGLNFFTRVVTKEPNIE